MERSCGQLVQQLDCSMDCVSAVFETVFVDV